MNIIFPVGFASGQEARRNRQPVVAGSFYPSGSEKLRTELKEFFSTCKGPAADVMVRAIIAPHAGYVYSGHTAAAAFASVPADADYDNIFLIGVSHRYGFEGAAVFTSGDMVTPLGTVPVNSKLGESLVDGSSWFIEKDEAHRIEHSLEVQLPFIQYHFKKSIPVIPVLIGTHNKNILKAVASDLKPFFTDRNLFVISSDFSHYPSYDDARKIDSQVSSAILTGKPDVFLDAVGKAESSGVKNLATAMCGSSAGLVLMYLTEGSKDIKYRNVEYTNSGDTPYGEKDKVVGYNAIVAEQNVTGSNAINGFSEEFVLTAQEKKTLLAIARDAINARVNGVKAQAVSTDRITPSLKRPLGAFVTITIDGNLRGCIGQFTSSEPLYKVVETMAVESALGDPRFPSLTGKEYPEIKIEISVLSPMKQISNINEIIIGKHGIYIKKGMRAGTLLPQVASERGWSVTEFLGYCARDKAGIGWDGWKDAEIYVYEACVFHE